MKRSKPKCLLVDDLPDNLIALSSLLKDEELEVHLAKSGNEALELLLSNDYALALVDVQMPEMDGFELAELMRGIHKTRSIPIIFVTAGDHDVKRIFQGYDAGAVDFLHKPLHPKIVLGKVRIFIELYNQNILLEETFRRVNEHLERKVQERTRELMLAKEEMEAFSYLVSHDLRAPLRSMEGFSDLLIKSYSDKLDEKGRDYLNRIRNSAQQMEELIHGMLALSKIGQQEIEYTKINFSKLCQKIVDELKSSQPQRNIQVSIEPNIIIEGDPALIQALAENLLNNAWKFTSKSTQARIEIGVSEDKNQKVLFVRDNGAGFNMKYAHKLFSPFQRLHNAKDFEGTGIGLVTVKRVLDRHKGKIWVESEEGKGTTFFFSLNSGK